MSAVIGIVRLTEAMNARVAGLTLGERAALALRRAGLARVVIVAPPGQAEAAARLVAAPRLPGAPDAWAPADDDSDGAFHRAAAGLAASGPAVVVTGPVAIDTGLVSALAARLDAGTVTAPAGVAGAVAIYPAGVPAEPLAAPLPDLPVPAGTAHPVRARKDRGPAKRALLQQSIKPLSIDGLICFLLVRRLSVRISALLLETPLTPNQITGLSTVAGLAAAACVAVGFWPWAPIGGALLFLSLVLDNCDGEVARVKYQFSTWGAWFDIYSDFVVNVAFMIGMAVGAYRVFDEPLYLYAGAFTAFAMSFYNGTVFRYIHRLGIPDEFLFKWWFDLEAEARGKPETAPEAPPPSRLGEALSVLKYAGRRDFFIFAYFVTALVGWLHWAFWATAVGAVLNFVMTVYHVFIWRGLPHDGRR
jgi:hypothetical protein